MRYKPAKGFHKTGTMDKKTMREFDVLCLTPVENMTPRKIRALRTRDELSQAVFAAYLNVTVGLVSKWERGEKKPSGASLKLVENKGLEVVA